ncbi:MAG: preprotein translocase subunit SecE [Actinomycetes bacterium]|nr:preprotein translocase subunit SecE [Actinomycetes bacterium]
MAKDNGTDSPKKNKQSGKAKAGTGRNAKPGIFSRFVGYLKGVRTELKRVTWPTRQEVLNSVVIVIVTLIFFAAFTSLVDLGATNLIKVYAKLSPSAAVTTTSDTTTQTAETTPTAETTTTTDTQTTTDTPTDATSGGTDTTATTGE